MPRQRESADTPRLDPDDSLTVQEASPTATQPEDPKSINSRVRSAIGLMSAVGPEAETRYQEALRELASDPQAAVTAVDALYRATPEERYLERWSQVHLLSELSQRSATSVLDNIVSTPIPPEKAPDMITYSTVGEEVMIRTSAIEGIARLAAGGDRQALEALRKHTRHDSFSVRRAAIQGYLEVGGPNARDELLRLLPEQDHFVLDIRRMDVQDVPQPFIERGSEERDDVPPARPPSRPSVEQ